jgi:hypothetical protein
MQIVNTSLPGRKVIFESILDEVPGGVGLNVTRLDYTTLNANVDKRFLPAGTPVYVDLATRIAEVCKSVVALATSSAQALKVPKNHHFKAGDLINDGVTTATISSVTTSVAGYDTIATDASLIYADGTKYGEGSATGTSAVLLYGPNGVTRDTIWIGDGNADVAVVTMGSVRADALTFPINTLYAMSLKGADTTGHVLATAKSNIKLV